MAVKKFLAKLAYVPILGRLLLMPYRCLGALRIFWQPTKNFVRWLFASREYTNYTYALSPINTKYLSAFVADVANISIAQADAYIKELQNDTTVKNHIQKAIKSHKKGRFADKKVAYGRRLGWYAIVRAKKPKVVVETGVDKGMGAVLLTAALARNRKDGYQGYYYGTDINPNAGYFLSGDYTKYGKILYGDSIESLVALDKQIDVFINDSDHSANYEAKEYETIADKLSNDAIIIGDNADITDKLFEFALKTNRQFMFFKEHPFKHWYPGSGIGIALNKKAV